MRRRIWIPILIVGGLIVGFLVLRPSPEPEVAEERTATIETGPLQVWVTGTGTVEPASQATLSFKTAGTLGEIAVEVGQQIQAGQILALLDPGSLAANLLGAEADLIAAQQALEDLLEGASEQQISQAAINTLKPLGKDIQLINRKITAQQHVHECTVCMYVYF